MPAVSTLPLAASPHSLAAARLLTGELLGQFRSDLAMGMDLEAATARLNNLYGRNPDELFTWALKAAGRQPIEARFNSALRRAVDGLQRDALAKVESSALANTASATRPPALLANAALANSGVAVDLLLDPSIFRDRLWTEMRGVHEEALDEAGQSQLRALGLDDPFTLPPKAAKEFLAKRQKWSDTIADDVFAKVKSGLQAGLDTGDTTAKLADRVRAAFGDAISPERAAVIAQTEAGAAYGFANNEALTQANRRGNLRKKWLTSGLPNTRHSHLEAAQRSKEGIPMDDAFSNGLKYPGDPDGPPEETINCHCTLGTVLVDFGGIA